jgi:hypothetical protein
MTTAETKQIISDEPGWRPAQQSTQADQGQERWQVRNQAVTPRYVSS